MTIRPIISGIAAFLFSVSGLTAQTPNVLLIISDDQAWTDYGFMGHPTIKTPHLDQLAAESLTFTRGYTPIALCRPALATLATGLYPHEHGVAGNDPAIPLASAKGMNPRADARLSPIYEAVIQNFARHPNFIRDLTSRGYLSLQTGKWWEGNPRETAGFTHAMTQGNPGRHGDDGLVISRKGHAPIAAFLDEAQASAKPWLIWHAPFLPHAPHTPPTDILARYLPLAPNEAVARYWANVDWFDQTCGELLAELDARGERDNTIIIYVCDNGWIQGSQINRFASRSKLTPYEGGIRSPIMISWRGKIVPLRDDTHLASNLDIWPTLAALLGVEAPASLPGINLTDPTLVAARPAIYGEQFAHDIANVFVPAESLHSRWTIAENWKLIAHEPLANASVPLELFDLTTDPHETTNLASTQPEKAAQLLAALDTWWTPYYPTPREYRAVE
jgi:arylsulfatase A-like enzyme